MEFNNYKIADVEDKSQIADRLAQVESDLSADIGGDVVLIAYQKQKDEIDRVNNI
jgi:hypothetical protein